MAQQKATEEQDTAIKAAVDKATSGLRSTPSAASEELTKPHAEELRALEERLVVNHREKAAEAAGTAKAQESGPAPVAVPTADNQKAVVDAAVAAAGPLRRQSSKRNTRLTLRMPSRAAGRKVQ